MVDSATQVVWAQAISADSLAKTVTFQPIEWLRRTAVAPGTLSLSGRVVEHDDFNVAPVPYQLVRAAGQHGDCFAQEYRLGAQYLLLLKDRPRPNTISWWPLAPVNEQVRGRDDPWLTWVRERIAHGTRLASSVTRAPQAIVLGSSEPCDGPAPVCALLRTFLTAFNARDFDAFRSTFADDLSFFVDRPYPPQRLDGRAAAEAVFAGGFAPYGAGAGGPKPPLPTPLVPSHLRVQVFGDIAIITFEVVRPTELARRTLVAHREGSEWRIVHIHASSADTKP